jgi:transposase-like protein
MAIRYDENTKARAVRLVREHVDDYETEWSAIKAIAGRLGMSAETLRRWVRQATNRMFQSICDKNCWAPRRTIFRPPPSELQRASVVAVCVGLRFLRRYHPEQVPAAGAPSSAVSARSPSSRVCARTLPELNTGRI